MHHERVIVGDEIDRPVCAVGAALDPHFEAEGLIRKLSPCASFVGGARRPIGSSCGSDEK